MEQNTPQRAAVIFNGEYTIRGPKGHKTVSIKTMSKDSSFAPGKRVIALLTGPDNTKDYTSFGFVTDNGINIFHKKRGPVGEPTIFEWVAKVLWDLVVNGALCEYRLRGYTLLSACTCIKCNRKLTDPISIETGIGPECSGRNRARKRRKLDPLPPEIAIQTL